MFILKEKIEVFDGRKRTFVFLVTLSVTEKKIDGEVQWYQLTHT